MEFGTILKGLVVILVATAVITLVIPAFTQPSIELASTEQPSVLMGKIDSMCTTWRITGSFLDIYIPTGLNEAFGLIGEDCSESGIVDPTLCRNKCQFFQKIMEVCNPNGYGFGMRCVEGPGSVRLDLEGV